MVRATQPGFQAQVCLQQQAKRSIAAGYVPTEIISHFISCFHSLLFNRELWQICFHLFFSYILENSSLLWRIGPGKDHPPAKPKLGIKPQSGRVSLDPSYCKQHAATCTFQLKRNSLAICLREPGSPCIAVRDHQGQSPDNLQSTSLQSHLNSPPMLPNISQLISCTHYIGSTVNSAGCIPCTAHWLVRRKLIETSRDQNKSTYIFSKNHSLMIGQQ